MLIQAITIIFVFFVLSKVVKRFRKGDIGVFEFIFWSIFWLVVGGVTLVLRKTDSLAQFLGVEKSADLLVYFSIVLIFYIIFKIFVKLDHLEQEITKIVRHLALEKKEKKNHPEL